MTLVQTIIIQTIMETLLPLTNKSREELNALYHDAKNRGDIEEAKRILHQAEQVLCYECKINPKLPSTNPHFPFCSNVCHETYGEKQVGRKRGNGMTIEEMQERFKQFSKDAPKKAQQSQFANSCAHPITRRHRYTDGSEACNDCNVLFAKEVKKINE